MRLARAGEGEREEQRAREETISNFAAHSMVNEGVNEGVATSGRQAGRQAGRRAERLSWSQLHR